MVCRLLSLSILLDLMFGGASIGERGPSCFLCSTFSTLSLTSEAFVFVMDASFFRAEYFLLRFFKKERSRRDDDFFFFWLVLDGEVPTLAAGATSGAEGDTGK